MFFSKKSHHPSAGRKSSERLLVIEPGLKMWGSERAFLTTLPDLVACFETVIVMLPQEAEMKDALRELGVTAVHAPIGYLHRAGRLAGVQAGISILRACRKYRISKIYLNQAGLCRIVHVAAALLHIPLVIHVRLREDIERCANLPSWPHVDLIYVSRDMAKRHPINARGGKRVTVAYDPFPLLDNIPVGAPSREICCVGRICVLKGQAELLEGISILNEKKVVSNLDLIGASGLGDPYEAELRVTTEKLVESGVVRFLGYQDCAAEMMRDYRIVAVPSLYETLGRVVMEAWAAGALPVCSRDSGGSAEIVATSGGGILYDGHSPRAIAGALEFALAMPEEKRQELVRRGATWAQKNLSLSSYRHALAGVLFP